MNGQRGNAHPAVATYLAAVRDELSDLPADELADITDDVREHLDQVAAEFGDGLTIGALIDRLGAPAAYAAELRAAAGLAQPDLEPESRSRRGFGRRLVAFMTAFFAGATAVFTVAGVLDAFFVSYGSSTFFLAATVSLVLAGACALLLVLRRADPIEALREVPGAGQVTRAYEWLQGRSWGTVTIETVGALRPAWWVARAAALGLVVAWFSTIPLGGVVFLATIAASVWLGRRTAAGQVQGGRLIAVHVANVGLAVGGVAVAVQVLDQLTPTYVEYVDYGPREYDPDTGIALYGGEDVHSESGEPVTNIYAYSADGVLLQNVRLYDQDGRPLELGVNGECYDGDYVDEAFTVPNPWGSNVYPRLTVTIDEFGECQQPELTAPFGDLLPGAEPTTAPSQTPSAPTNPTTTPSPAPTPSPTATPNQPPGPGTGSTPTPAATPK